MHAYHSPSPDIAYSDEAPTLIVASSDAARAKSTEAVIASGTRIGGECGFDDALQRLDQQARMGVLWIEIDRDGGGPMDELLMRVNRDVAEGRYSAVVSTRGECLDPVLAQLGDSDLELIADAGDAERVAALALVSNGGERVLRVSDITSDHSAVRLRQLSEEVNRIAATLARLSSAPAPANPAWDASASDDAPPVAVERVRAVLRARRLRSRFFSEDLFADPAWDMLLDLFQAEISQLRVPVSSLCIAAAVPATTALRWLKTMVSRGLFVRRSDPHDGRRVFVELSPEASKALRRYFAEVDLAAVI